MATEMRVWDAAMIEQDDDGYYIMVQVTLHSRALGRRRPPVVRHWRLAIPDRFADIVAESKRTSRPVRAYYKGVLGRTIVADLVELA